MGATLLLVVFGIQILPEGGGPVEQRYSRSHTEDCKTGGISTLTARTSRRKNFIRKSTGAGTEGGFREGRDNEDWQDGCPHRNRNLCNRLVIEV